MDASRAKERALQGRKQRVWDVISTLADQGFTEAELKEDWVDPAMKLELEQKGYIVTRGNSRYHEYAPGFLISWEDAL